MNRIEKSKFARYLEAFDFRTLFNELGWDNDSGASAAAVDKTSYSLRHVAHKSGFKILHCECAELPDYPTRRKIDTQASRLFRDHILIFTDTARTQQIWFFIVREAGKPARAAETLWRKGQAPDLLFQRAAGLFFHLDEEDNITILDVKERVAANFAANAEKVTKKFYEQFRKQHHAFMDFIQGISAQGDREWYASLMLNRLMFCYFIQKKDFLDRNRNYLRDKLQAIRERQGKGHFYSFYRDFLLALFHKGLGGKERPSAFEQEFGRIPYLNGGLFDEHELELRHGAIQIPDEAFEQLFDFFDQYEWHLDNRPTASGKDVNPDVIGYIFEKYINDRAQMGAYYTKEDITEYISKSCILPFLFEEARRRSKKDIFAPGKEADALLRNSGDRYIFESVRKGIDLPLPAEIAEGLDASRPGLLERRRHWNKAADEAYALPTEIWRETVERRQRCERLRAAIAGGEVRGIDDFVTLNLDIRQFAEDFLSTTGDPDWLRSFYEALRAITVLDPTCGSGAFLFAALNILEPLYAACLQRMRSFVAEAPKGKHKTFEAILAEIERPEHPNEAYYIHKSIILQNLYGVDIMREAVEIAKLRLFLRLAATVEADYARPNLGLEPLPDVDFNIRAGNTLVGYATLQEAMFNIERKEGFFAAEKLTNIRHAAEKVSMAFGRFRDAQLISNTGSEDFRQAKQQLSQELAALNEQLNRYLALSYMSPQAAEQPEFFKPWLASHQPFHWCTEFYRIIEENKGFDVVIGNPPYVELREVKNYALKSFATKDCGNLYALTYERVVLLSGQMAKIGFIIPVASVCTGRYEPLQKLWKGNGNVFISSFNDRPGKLFENLEHIRLSIVLLWKCSQPNIHFSTKYLKWHTEFREYLFESISYGVAEIGKDATIPKTGSSQASSIQQKLNSEKYGVSAWVSKSGPYVVYYTRKLSGFVQILDFIPKILDKDGNVRAPSELKEVRFSTVESQRSVLCLLNSSLFYWFLTVWSDCRNLNSREVLGIQFDLKKASSAKIDMLKELSKKLMIDIEMNSKIVKMNYQAHGQMDIQCIFPKYSKPLIDQIDTVLAEHYGFTEEELDYIINYDIKYRMGGAEEE